MDQPQNWGNKPQRERPWNDQSIPNKKLKTGMSPGSVSSAAFAGTAAECQMAERPRLESSFNMNPDGGTDYSSLMNSLMGTAAENLAAGNYNTQSIMGKNPNPAPSLGQPQMTLGDFVASLGLNIGQLTENLAGLGAQSGAGATNAVGMPTTTGGSGAYGAGGTGVGGALPGNIGVIPGNIGAMPGNIGAIPGNIGAMPMNNLGLGSNMGLGMGFGNNLGMANGMGVGAGNMTGNMGAMGPMDMGMGGNMNMGMGMGMAGNMPPVAPNAPRNRQQRNLDGPPMDVQQLRVLEPFRPKIAGSRTVFVGNLSDQITDDDMLRLFGYCGEIENIEWINDRKTGKFRGCAFIEFYEDAATQEAVKNNGAIIFGRPLRVDYAANRSENRDGDRRSNRDNRGHFDRQGGRHHPRDNFGGGGFRPREDSPPSERPPGCKTLFIGQLSDAVDDQVVHEVFASAGKIKAIRWLNDRITNKFKGCGFVEFFEEEATLRGIQLNGTVVLGKRMRVDYSQGPNHRH